jgi:tetratricopeptide (TPR) repeat protein
MEAVEDLSTAERRAPLEPEDGERLAIATYLLGRDQDSVAAWERAHRAFLARGDVVGAVRCAGWLVLVLFSLGELARGGGWLARARRLLDDAGHDHAEQACLLVPVAFERATQGDWPSTYAIAADAAAIGDRFGDIDFVTLARNLQGRALIAQGRTEDGMSLLDEAMVAVLADDVSEIVAGSVYCSVIEACQAVFDLRRAQEWTAALTRWCESQPDLVPFSGSCLVHRAEVMQLHGAWPDALDAAQRACERLRQRPGPASGAAFYQKAELHRLRGEFAPADDAYREAHRWGREPQPGLARLRLMQGRIAPAAAAIRRALDAAGDRATRGRLLPALVEILLAAGDIGAARVAADELSELAAELDAPLLDALAKHANGAVQLGEGDPRSALAALREAWTAWQRLGVPYEAARSRVLSARACRRLGDAETAELELAAACSVFEASARHPTSRTRGRSPPRRNRREASRRASSRCSALWRPAGPTARSPPSWSSARRRSPATSATSSPSSICRAGPRPPLTPTSTI